MAKKASRPEPPITNHSEQTLTKIVPKGEKLSKDQQIFNRLTQQIATLKTSIEKANDTLRELQAQYDKYVRPEMMILGKNKIRMSHLLHEKRDQSGKKWTKQSITKLDELIVGLLEDAFYVVKPSEKDKELYDFYAAILANKAKQESPNIVPAKKQFAENAAANTTKPKKQKSKKTLDKEEREKQKQILKQKSIRNIYLSLAKILHPDTELDQTIKVKKEEYMKRVTIAYNNKNLPELLELEMEWIHGNENKLSETSDGVLVLYNEMLKEQATNLEEEMFFVFQNPAYSNVVQYNGLPFVYVTNLLKQKKKAYIATHKNFEIFNSELEYTTNIHASISECIDFFGQKI